MTEINEKEAILYICHMKKNRLYVCRPNELKLNANGARNVQTKSIRLTVNDLMTSTARLLR